jgi:signal transduction histidine kinase
MNDQRFSGGDSVQRYGIRSAMCVPIKFKDRLFGVIHIDSKIINYTFTADQLKLLVAIGVHTGLAMTNAALYSERLSRERLAAVGTTVASLSHSIKNIIQGLRGGAEVVELGFKKDNVKVVKGGWDIVSRNLERISQLTLNMLAYSKQRRPELEQAGPLPLLEELSELVQSQYDEKGVALLTEFDPDLPTAPLDESGLHQAILNLLTNALDAVEPQIGAVQFEADFEEASQSLRIAVADNGVGISPDRLGRIFQPFESTKGQRGTGLGLAVARKIVEEHGGRLDVESKPGEGTRFTIRLPVELSAAAGAADTHHGLPAPRDDAEGPPSKSPEPTDPLESFGRSE